MKKVRALFPTQNPLKKEWRRDDPETDGKRDELQKIMRNLFGVIDMFIILIMVGFQESLHINTHRHTYLYQSTYFKHAQFIQSQSAKQRLKAKYWGKRSYNLFVGHILS